MAEGALDDLYRSPLPADSIFALSVPIRNPKRSKSNWPVLRHLRAREYFCAPGREPLAPRGRSEMRMDEALSAKHAAGIWGAPRTCVPVADACLRAAGGRGGLLIAPPLQRRLRDLHTLIQHAALSATPI